MFDLCECYEIIGISGRVNSLEDFFCVKSYGVCNWIIFYMFFYLIEVKVFFNYDNNIIIIIKKMFMMWKVLLRWVVEV